MAFENAQWIWRADEASPDEFVDFYCTFPGSDGEWKLNISADSDYNVYINGKLVTFGQYADYPFYKVYDEVDVSEYIKKDGENKMLITVWYYGVDSQTYIKGQAGLIFDLQRDGHSVVVSSDKILSRMSSGYVPGRCKKITVQLGLTYRYDTTALNKNEFLPSEIQPNRSKQLFLRPIKKLQLQERTPVCIVHCGSYKYVDADQPAEIKMQNAELAEVEGAKEMPTVLRRTEGYDGIFAIIDMGSETAGFLELDFRVPCVAEIDIGYGEHLIDGRCRTQIGSRGFEVGYVAKPGHNHFVGSFRRLGGRYIQLFVPAAYIELIYVGIRATTYPVVDSGVRPHAELRRRIYDVAVNTLIHCMHEHYEDCPWREQALYTMDSRNQMLCGYYAFGEFEFARASLLLISKGVRKDGLLSLCYPAGLDFPIPAFSLMYFVQMWEYIKYSGDDSLARELYPMLTELMNVFIRRIESNGLIQSFPDCWNFYEWSHSMSGSMRGGAVRFEAPINAFMVLALRALADICDALEYANDAALYRDLANQTSTAIRKYFWCPDVGLFRTYHGEERYSVLTNSLCLLCGAAENVDTLHIMDILAHNGENEDAEKIIPNTLSMNSFRFDALLRQDAEKYAPIILAELDRDYGYMLSQDATTFWETIVGAADFSGAGSLCHGWSALPIYYYSILDPGCKEGK